MHSFIDNVVRQVISSQKKISKCTFILPSKRAGLFLKQSIKTNLKGPSILPEIYSIEEFIEQLSQLKNIDNIEALFEFYNIYKDLTPLKDLEPFSRFSRWASVMLQDFNEIDRNLIPPNKIFNYLDAIHDINHWSLDSTPTKMVKDYLKFWKKINLYYNNFSKQLLNNGVAYQGLGYKAAVQNLDNYIDNTSRKSHIFLGFNALNKSEELIFQRLLDEGIAEVFWDCDRTFLDSKFHDSGLFMRNYIKTWPYYKKNKFNFKSDNFKSSKKINITGATKHIGQVKYAAELLFELHKKNNLKNTAVVLADEALLLPLINSIPPEIGGINITMGFPMSQAPLNSLISSWFKIHSTQGGLFYYKDVIDLISNPQLNQLFNNEQYNSANNLIRSLKSQNITEVTLEGILELDPKIDNLSVLLFDDCKGDVSNCIERLLILLDKIRNVFDKNSNKLISEYAIRFYELIDKIKSFNSKYNIVDSIKTLESLFNDVVGKERLNFNGDPFSGLQIMGMLETRAIDYETVIILSLNEGVIPAGKSQNSYIPFDVKIENSLPTYKEKDAIYTYHFYRLLHRAKDVQLIYNTHSDSIRGSEPSRFLTQLQTQDIHKCNHQILAPEIIQPKKTVIKINKTLDIISKLKIIADKGFSPSSLAQYIRNPIDFYNFKVLGIRELDGVEETIEAKTFGNIIHYTLEELYKPFEGQFLKSEELKKLIPKLDKVIMRFYNRAYKNGNITRGKNLISFEIAKRYISNFIRQEINNLDKGHKIKIYAVEKQVETILNHPSIRIPVRLKGSIDRLDSFDGVFRIIDYKTSKVSQSDLNLINLLEVINDYKKYNKIFQLLMYAYILIDTEEFQPPFELGIYSFKNLKSGFLKLKLKDKSLITQGVSSSIDDSLINGFEKQLALLLNDIFCVENDFVEKEV